MPNKFSIQSQNQDGLLTDIDSNVSASSIPFSKELKGTQPQDILLSPGGTLLEPGLKKLGVPGGLAFGLGLGADIFIPGPGGELKSGINLLKNASKIPETIYKGLLKNLTGKEVLNLMDIRELNVIKNALENAPKSAEGK